MHTKSFLLSILVVLIGCGDGAELLPEATGPALAAAAAAVGRDRELATMGAALTSAARTVIVSGEAGIGKTTLIAAFAATHAVPSGWRVLYQRCDEYVREPYQPLRGLVAQLVESIPEASLAAHEATWGGEVFRLAPQLRAPTSAAVRDVVGDQSTARFLLFEAVADLARRAAEVVPTVLVLDEASMVDVISMSRICGVLPSHVRLVLVGDPHQLMPVGPGLVLHAMGAVPGVPFVELKTVKRYGGAIAAAAAGIRAGRWPEFSDDETAPVAFLPCRDELIAETVVELMALDRVNSQVLCAVRNGPAGTKGLNALCQERFAAHASEVRKWNDEFDCAEGVGLRLGDTVLCTRNLWAMGLQNGSLGTIVEVEDMPRALHDDAGEVTSYALAWVEWDDGQRRPLTLDMLEDVELGYAITVHKAQGSQWPRIIVPVTQSRLLDRTLLYTALTRAQTQVLLVGDVAAARAAVLAQPRANERKVALDLHLAKLGQAREREQQELLG